MNIIEKKTNFNNLNKYIILLQKHSQTDTIIRYKIENIYTFRFFQSRIVLTVI